MKFTFDSYKIFLKRLQSLGKCVTFNNWDGGKSFLLRFDIDFDLNAALRIAKINEEFGLKSTFFILVSSPFYNVLSIQNRKIIKAISDTGGEIALHFDPLVYESFEQLEEKVNQEAELLSSIIGTKIFSVSLHNPSVYNKYPLFSGYINAYDQNMFKDSMYISDSRMNFREKNIDNFIENISNHAIQITLHPLHFNESELTYPQIFFNHLISYINRIDSDFKDNSTYIEQSYEAPLSLFLNRTS